MISHFTQPVLSIAPDALQDIYGGDALSNLWIGKPRSNLLIALHYSYPKAVFSRCKDSIQDGERLENISWRLWYRELVTHAPPSTPFSEAAHCKAERQEPGFPFPTFAEDKQGQSRSRRCV
jgi:hypothetical protein